MKEIQKTKSESETSKINTTTRRDLHRPLVTPDRTGRCQETQRDKTHTEEFRKLSQAWPGELYVEINISVEKEPEARQYPCQPGSNNSDYHMKTDNH